MESYTPWGVADSSQRVYYGESLNPRILTKEHQD